MIQVHKACEPAKLSKAGKARFAALLQNPNAIVLPKYDGVYCQIKFVDGKWSAWSRTGEPLPSVGPAILDAFKAYSPDLTFIGELWVLGEQHAVINGMARKQSAQPGLGLVLHDVVLPNDTRSYRLRLLFLRQHGPWGRGVFVAESWARGSAGQDDLYTYAREWAQQHSAYDGLILRDPDGLFIPGDGKGGEIIKIKPRNSGDFRVVGVVEGKGKAAGMAGALVLDLGGGVTCEVGTGLSDEVRRDYWNYWHAVDKPEHQRIAEIEYLAVTKDGRLREPSFKSTRWDKTVADVLPGNIKGAD